MTYLWQMTLLGGICTLLLMVAKTLILKKGGGKWYCWLWLLALFAYVFPYKLVFFTRPILVENTAVTPVVASYLPEVQTNLGGTALPAEIAISTAEISFSNIRMGIYGIGLVGFFLYYLMSYIFLQMRMHREAKEIQCAVLDEARKELGIKRKIALKVDRRIQTPLFFGILQPTILLPPKYYDKEELYFLLCHELTHYKSCHIYLRLLALFVHMIHWFNPLSYVALRQIQEACEYACDEGVTERMSGEKRLVYSYLLLRGTCPSGTSVFSLGFGGNRKKDVLKRRITVIMEKKKKKKIQKVGIAVLAVGTLTVCGSFFDLKPIYAGAGTPIEYEIGTKPQFFLWTNHVKTEKEAISLAKEYVEKVFQQDVKGLSVTAEYHDAKEQQPEGWLIRFVPLKKMGDTKEFAVWLTKEGNTMAVRRSTFAKGTKKVLPEEAWQKLLEDNFWVTEAKKFVENSPWQKEKAIDVKVISNEGQRNQEEVCVSVDTASGAKYMLYFHPWKELWEVQYCPPVPVEYHLVTQPRGLLWIDQVKTKEDAVVFAKKYVEQVLHGNTENLVATVEYHDRKDNSVHPEGWLIQLSSPEQKKNEREYAVWLEKEGNQVAARQKSLKNKSQNISGEEWKSIHKGSKEERDALLQDEFWIKEAKKIVKGSTLQKEKILDVNIVPNQQYYVLVGVDTASGAKYLVSFHPWKELSSVKYCPPMKQDKQVQNLENQVAEVICEMPNVKQVEVNMNASVVEGIPSVSVTTKNQQPLTKETVTNIQKLVADSLKGVEAEEIPVYCNEKGTFSVERRKDGNSPLFLAVTKNGTKENETLNVNIEEGQPVLVKTENIPSGLPVEGKISKDFDGKKHLGMDIDTNKKALPILATADGTVTEAKFDKKIGNYVVIDHGNGFVTKYAYNAKNMVKEGEKVEKGKEIALAGKTGMATGVHCHYEVWKNGVSQNPYEFM